MRSNDQENNFFEAFDRLVGLIIFFSLVSIPAFYVLTVIFKETLGSELVIFFQSVLTNLFASAFLFLASYLTVRKVQKSRADRESDYFVKRVSSDVVDRITDNLQFQIQLAGLEDVEKGDIQTIIVNYPKQNSQSRVNSFLKHTVKEMLAELATVIRDAEKQNFSVREGARYSFLFFGMGQAKFIQSVVIYSSPNYWKTGFGRHFTDFLCNLAQNKGADVKINRIWILPDSQLEECYTIIKNEQDAGIEVKVINFDNFTSPSVDSEFLIIVNNPQEDHVVKTAFSEFTMLERMEEHHFSSNASLKYRTLFHNLFNHQQAESVEQFALRKGRQDS